MAVSASTFGGEIHVSTTGSDSNPGTKSEPLKTLAAAQQGVRKLKTTDRGTITVLLARGTWYLPETLVLTAEDSGTKDAPVTYAAVEGEKVVLSGGQKVNLDWKPYKEGIMQAKVPDGFTSDQLFVNGQRRQMARYPNYDPTAQYFNGFSADCIGPARVRKWADPTGGFLHAMHRSLWGDFHYRITGKDGDEKVKLVGGWQNNRKMGMHGKFRFVENIFEELDAPGEWYLDSKKNVLYYYPPKGVDLAKATVEAVRLRHLVEFRGSEKAPVKFVTFRGITFTHTARTFMDNKEPLLRSDWTTYRGGAIFFNGVEDCAVRDCILDQVGGNAVFVSKYNRRITVSGCRIADAGASAVAFVGDPKACRSPLFEYHQAQTLEAMDKTPGPRTANYPADCLVEDNLIYRNGRVEKQTAGVNISMSARITVRHNSIYDCPRAGINICEGTFGGHLIEFNDVFDTVNETGDHGSFNSWGRDRFWHPNRGRIAEWVKQHPEMPKWDCRETIIIRNNRWRCDHGWDIDLDDGSSNYELYNNLCLAGGIKLREGYFRKVSNNIMVNYTFCPHVWYPNCKTTFTRNIVWKDGYAPAGMRKIGQEADYNLVHSPGAKERPAAGMKKFSRGDAHSLVADAMFVDPLKGDYRVKEGSPALKLGFKNFPMDKFGVQKPELKARAKTPPLPGTLAAASIRSGGWGRRYAAPKSANWLGARIKNIQSQGEMSAAGLGNTDGVLVYEVRSGSAAENAGFKTNDVILNFNGPTKNIQAFAKNYAALKAGAEITIEIWRDQKKQTLKFRKQRR